MKVNVRYPKEYRRFVPRIQQRAWEMVHSDTGIEHVIYGTFNVATHKDHWWKKPMLFRSDETFQRMVNLIYSQHKVVMIRAVHR